MNTDSGIKLTVGGGLGGGLLSRLTPHCNFLTISSYQAVDYWNVIITASIGAAVGAVIGFLVHEALIAIKSKYF